MNKLKMFLTVLFFFNSINVFSETLDPRKDQIIKIINEELFELKRLDQLKNGKDPQIMMRMSELYLEKGRLIREDENEKFLKIPIENRRKINKSSYFRVSSNYFQKAESICKVIVTRYRNTPEMADAYYVLAYYAKERGDLENAKIYFENSIKLTKDKKSKQRSQMSLAEIFYSEKKFSSAIAIYEKYLNRKSDRWWTKEMFNLAWCYFRTLSVNKAINLMKNIFETSKSSNFIDMRSLVLRDISFFYASSKRINEAISFYEKQNVSISENLQSLAEYLTKEARPTLAIFVLEKILKMNVSDEISIKTYFMLMDLYLKYDDDSKLIPLVNIVKKYYSENKLGDDQKENFIYILKKRSSIIQKQLVKNDIKDKKKAFYAEIYFNILAEIFPKISSTQFLYIGETYYFVALYEKAAEYYIKSLESSEKNNDLKSYDASLDGLKVILFKKKVSIKVKNKYLPTLYSKILKRNPKSEESNKVYQHLFSIHFDNGDYLKAYLILKEFSKNFPESVKKKDVMAIKLVEKFRSKKMSSELFTLASDVESGAILISSKLQSKLKKIVLNEKFSNIEKNTKNGDKVEVLRGYINLYNDPKSSLEVKKKSAYNISTLYYELGDSDAIYKWLNISLDSMNENEIISYRKDIFLMSLSLFWHLKFDESKEISIKVIKRLCKSDRDEKLSFINNMVTIFLAEEKYSDALAFIDSVSKCKLKNDFYKSIYSQVLTDLPYVKNPNTIENIINSIYDKNGLYSKIILSLGRVYNELNQNSRFDLAKKISRKILKYHELAKSKNEKIELESLDIVSKIKIDELEIFSENIKKQKLRFPDKLFNSILEKKFKKIDQISTQIFDVMKIGSGKGVVRSYKLLISIYKDIVDEINNFIPEGKSESYIKSFKSSMNQITGSLESKINEYYKSGIRQIEKNNILSEDNWFFYLKNKKVNFKFIPIKNGILMDRLGK